MNKIQFDNLMKIFDMKFAHICLNNDTLGRLLYGENASSDFKRKYYPTYDPKFISKYGFINNGATTIWATYSMGYYDMKFVSNREAFSKLYDDQLWSPSLSFESDNSIAIIQKYIKLKSFW